MPSELFTHHFPALGVAETRSLGLAAAAYGVPPGNYAFLEAYCTEPGCDCRRALIHVVERERGFVALVSFGFDRAAPMAGPYCDPLYPIPDYAAGLVRLLSEQLFSDPAYVERLQRHYRMMKDEAAPTAGRPKPSPAQRAAERKKKRKKGERFRPPT